jgi:hypothetical protein
MDADVPSLVATGASLTCSFGTAPATFAASSVDVGATTAAGVVDDIDGGNVPSFGLCTSLANPQVASATSAAGGTLTPQTCVPVLSPWTPGAANVTIDEVPALDESSTCSCAWGGVVSVDSAGQTAVSVD